MRIGLVLLVTLAALAGCTETEGARAPADTRAVAAAEPLYVDVRRADEWQAGHIEGALHIPVEELEQRWQELVPHQDRQIVLYCRSGRRSGIALDLLRQKGFTLLENGGSLQQVAGRGRSIVR